MLCPLLIFCSFTSLLALSIQEVREELLADEDFMAKKAECMKELNMKPEDFVKVEEQKEIPEQIFCMMKCIQKKQGLLDENNKFDVEKFKADNKRFDLLPEEKKKEILECVAGMDPIKECTDVKKLGECFKVVLE